MHKLAYSLIVFYLVHYGDPFGPQVVHQLLDVVHSVVHHHLLSTVAEVVGLSREWTPYRATHLVAVFLFIPFEGVSVGVARNAQVVLLPLFHLCIDILVYVFCLFAEICVLFLGKCVLLPMK